MHALGRDIPPILSARIDVCLYFGHINAFRSNYDHVMAKSCPGHDSDLKPFLRCESLATPTRTGPRTWEAPVCDCGLELNFSAAATRLQLQGCGTGQCAAPGRSASAGRGLPLSGMPTRQPQLPAAGRRSAMEIISVMSGKIIKSMTAANPFIPLEEIDRMGRDFGVDRAPAGEIARLVERFVSTEDVGCRGSHHPPDPRAQARSELCRGKRVFFGAVPGQADGKRPGVVEFVSKGENVGSAARSLARQEIDMSIRAGSGNKGKLNASSFPCDHGRSSRHILACEEPACARLGWIP